MSEKKKYIIYWQEKHAIDVEAESAEEAANMWKTGEIDISYSDLVEVVNVEVWDEMAQGKHLDVNEQLSDLPRD